MFRHMKHDKAICSNNVRISVVLMLIFGSIFSLSILRPSSMFLLSDAQTSPSSTEPEVVITYPDENQTLPTGTLAIFGTSSDNAKTRCTVSALLNDERPYQNVTASGPASGDDYSKWTFTFDPYYTLIKEGQNEIVSKIVCENNGGANSTAFNKVNVTGVAPEEMSQ
ncbi:MAG: hypothetical protein WA461_14780 [Nitrososphaeraceae archaeon]